MRRLGERRRLAGAAVLVVVALHLTTFSVRADATPAPTPAATIAASSPSPSPSPSPQPSSSSEGGPCDVSPILGALCSIGNAIDSVPGAVVSGIGDSIVGAITRWVADSAAWALGQVTGLLDHATAPDLNAPWFQRNYATMAQLAGILLVIFLFAAAVQGLLRGSPSLIVRAYLAHAPAAILGTAVAIAVVNRGIAATDAMSTAISSHMQHDVGASLDHVATAILLLTRGDHGGSLFFVVLASLASVVIAFLLWVELLLREAAVDICVLFLPLGLAASVWPATAKWTRRLVGLLSAVVLSKFVIVAILALATSALAADLSDGGVKAVVVGVVLLGLAVYCPYLLLLVLPGAGAATVARTFGQGYRRVVGTVTATAGRSHALAALTGSAASPVRVAGWPRGTSPGGGAHRLLSMARSGPQPAVQTSVPPVSAAGGDAPTVSPSAPSPLSSHGAAPPPAAAPPRPGAERPHVDGPDDNV
jgi:hypothetical protein